MSEKNLYLVAFTEKHPKYNEWKKNPILAFVSIDKYNANQSWYKLLKQEPMTYKEAYDSAKELTKSFINKEHKVTLHDNLLDVKEQLFDAPMDVKLAFNSILRYFTDNPENFQAQEAGGDSDKSKQDKNAEDNSDEKNPSGDSSKDQAENSEEKNNIPEPKVNKDFIDPKSVKGGFNKLMVIIKNNKGKTRGELKNDLTNNGFEIKLNDKKINITGNNIGDVTLDNEQLTELEIK